MYEKNHTKLFEQGCIYMFSQTKLSLLYKSKVPVLLVLFPLFFFVTQLVFQQVFLFLFPPVLVLTSPKKYN